ncbi:ATP-binding protein [Burkholderia pyrrocinia]|uniref:ATP-binding protein n=1 Tax=Burkholderia pyrrocinia TaxID=60550 RepID=UPI001BCD7E12|nr:ATP-binding protein [Burkholderia pyrrocinia]QVN17475.1 ATP-binding protein [Burkholderia pyrrocinia]
MNSHNKENLEEDFDIVEPEASNLVEALRDIGYSLKSAAADIIDNSISASARHIDIRFGWSDNHQPWIAIIDDGEGMSETDLVEAMRPGGKDPLGKRRVDDLGRFGLGLKTASFSQCRELTVISRQDGPIACRQWNLDLVRKCNHWVLRRPGASEIAGFPVDIAELGSSGTIVLWRQLDRLDLGADPKHHHQVMNERIATICDHVALVFHRFITGEPGKPKIAFRVNGSAIEGYDPFNSRHPATMHLGEEVLEIEGKTVTLCPYILPHHSKVSTSEYKALGGKEGYLRGQGFYIYRNRRLIIHGTWFRMARQEEITKLARVQVDIPNTLDHLWTIDVRKSRAQPPEAVRRRLRGILDRIRDSAKRPYTHRGTAALNSARQPVWLRRHHNDRISYVPNLEHPLVDEFRSDLPTAMRPRFDGIMAVIGATLPFATLFNDMASRPNETDTSRETTEALEALAELLYGEGGTDPAEIERVMRITEPFCSAPEFVAQYIKRLHAKEKGE